MLIHFNSSSGEFTMHGEVAIALLKLMGHSGTVPSAILAADIPAAVARLRDGLKHAPPPPPAQDEEDGDPEYVPLQRRAVPLIELLENAAKDGADVVWDKV
jgi:hypothetical protein